MTLRVSDELRIYLEQLIESGWNEIILTEKFFHRGDACDAPGQSGTPEKPDRARLLELRQIASGCTSCSLHRSRNHVVFGEGNPAAGLMFVGEAPGREEDLQGEPFVGEAGRLLTRMIRAIEMSREDVYICNVLKCRPPSNRNPFPDEIKKCTPFLEGQIEVIRPKVICTLGLFASQFILGSRLPLRMLRGKAYDYRGIKIFPTYHPAALLRSPQLKREAWVDLQNVQLALQQYNEEQ